MGDFRDAGKIGVPPGVKSSGRRVDFKDLNGVGASDFDLLIETKCPRYAWSRAAFCPCAPINDQTEQPDPNCGLCNGKRVNYFAPADYVVDTSRVGELTDEQYAIIENFPAAIIKALVTSASVDGDMFNALGMFAFGRAQCTVRQANRLGYYDRLTALDEIMAHQQRVEFVGGELKTHYPIHSLNHLRDIDQIYTADDVCLEAGRVVFNTPPAEGTQMAIHYNCHPVWIVESYAKVSRASLVLQKKSSTTTPEGDILQLPGQVIIRLEHVPPTGGAND